MSNTPVPVPNPTAGKPKPKTWNLKAFAEFFDTTEDGVYAVSAALTRVMHAHPSPGKYFRTKAEKTVLENFLRAHLHELPACVADAGENKDRMDALSGLFRRIKSQGMVYLLKDEGEGKPVRGVRRMGGAGTVDQGGAKSQEGKAEDGHETKEEDDKSQDKGEEVKGNDPARVKGEHVPNNNSEGSSSSYITATDSDSSDSDSSNSTSSDSGSSETVSDSSITSSSTEEDEMDIERWTNNEVIIAVSTMSQPRVNFEQGLTGTVSPIYQLHTFMLTGNIWVQNEMDPRKHGLCPIQDLMTTRKSKLTGLDFDRWIASVKEQCGYDASQHRLEYRGPATIGLFACGKDVSIPILTGSQWRGVLNAHAVAGGDKNAVFYMVAEGGPEHPFKAQVSTSLPVRIAEGAEDAEESHMDI